ncbi:MAG: alpha/beta hydrolase [Lysobacterales bacterium]|jgi:pimeloyl-ACP methyl ester carboxylesterase
MNGREVVLVHGLWFGPWSMRLLARRLRRAGFRTRFFRYRTTRGSLERHTRDLRALIGDAAEHPPHIVAHSLGGLVTLKLLAETSGLEAAHVVLLGSPLRGSVVARKAGRIPGGRKLIGAARGALLSGHQSPLAPNAVGMIAGTRGFGLGLLVGGLGGPGDGTVALAETRAEGLVDRLECPVTHTGMLFSREVARQVAEFLHRGRFDHSRQ